MSDFLVTPPLPIAKETVKSSTKKMWKRENFAPQCRHKGTKQRLSGQNGYTSALSCDALATEKTFMWSDMLATEDGFLRRDYCSMDDDTSTRSDFVYPDSAETSSSSLWKTSSDLKSETNCFATNQEEKQVTEAICEKAGKPPVDLLTATVGGSSSSSSSSLSQEDSEGQFDWRDVKKYDKSLSIPRYRKRAHKKLDRKKQLDGTRSCEVNRINAFLRTVGLCGRYQVDFQINNSKVFHAVRVDLCAETMKGLPTEVSSAVYSKNQRHERALKIVYDDEIRGRQTAGCTPEESAMREILFCKAVDQVPYFVQYYNAHYNIKSGALIISMEYSDFGDILRWLRTYSGGLSEKKALAIFRQIAQGVKYLHDKDIAHRDLKLDNIVFFKHGQSKRFKILDFGLACHVYNDRIGVLNMTCGTRAYISYTMAAHLRSQTTRKAERSAKPGIWATQRGTLWDPRKNDTWSLGMILFALLHGHMAYAAPQNNVSRLATVIETTKLRISPAHSKPARHLLRHMLKLDEEKRFDIEQVFRHPWMREKSGQKSKSTADMLLSPQDRASLNKRGRRESVDI
jgi:serine/threonine protein kinase